MGNEKKHFCVVIKLLYRSFFYRFKNLDIYINFICSTGFDYCPLKVAGQAGEFALHVMLEHFCFASFVIIDERCMNLLNKIEKKNSSLSSLLRFIFNITGLYDLQRCIFFQTNICMKSD